jgi:hypothetical protein
MTYADLVAYLSRFDGVSVSDAGGVFVVSLDGDVLLSTDSLDVLRGFVTGWTAMFMSGYRYA